MDSDEEKSKKTVSISHLTSAQYAILHISTTTTVAITVTSTRLSQAKPKRSQAASISIHSTLLFTQWLSETGQKQRKNPNRTNKVQKTISNNNPLFHYVIIIISIIIIIT